MRCPIGLRKSSFLRDPGIRPDRPKSLLSCFGIRVDLDALARDGCRARVRAFRPAGGAPQAALIYLHGGTWSRGSAERHWDITAGGGRDDAGVQRHALPAGAPAAGLLACTLACQTAAGTRELP